MLITFKVLPNAEKDEWVGWFGESLLKVRLQAPEKDLERSLVHFVCSDLGTRPESMKLIETRQKHFFTFEMPDVAWELFLTIIEK
jgi:uncharacterized protein YggU (UPF0235/DUF167 family)